MKNKKLKKLIKYSVTLVILIILTVIIAVTVSGNQSSVRVIKVSGQQNIFTNKSESAEMISPLNCCAHATDKEVFPEAVAPQITKTFAIKQSS